jgi:subfamily B ATP-binding cassette protein MsbA
MNRTDSLAASPPRPLHRMVALARPHASGIALCLVLILITMAIQLSLPLGVRLIFDRVLGTGGDGHVHLIAAGLLLVFVLRSLLGYFGQFLLQRIGDRIVTDLRRLLFDHYHALSLGYHQQRQVGDLLSRLSLDVAALRNVVSNLAVSCMTNVFQLVGATAVMLWMDWRLGLIVLATAPLVTVTARLFDPAFRRLSAGVQDALADANSIAQESLSGIEVTKTFARGTHEVERYGGAMTRFFAAAVAARKADAGFNALVAFLTSFSTIAIFWFGGLAVAEGTLSAGTLVAFLLYSQTVTQGIAGIAQHYSGFSQAAGASRRVFEILDTGTETHDRPGAVPFRATRAIVGFDGVGFEYRAGSPVLEDINLCARPGETVALVGASGAGKSTLLKLIPRLFDTSAGVVSINGRDVRDYTLQSLREAVAVVPQDVFLFGGTLRENIRYGRLDATDDEVAAAARAANAQEFIERLPDGYDTLVGERGVQLSGGQRQRIAIARALLKDAPILILDEATSAVDAHSEALIREAVERLKAQRTTFVIAHRPATVRSADQTVTLTRGRITARSGGAAPGGRRDKVPAAAVAGR